MEANCFVFPIPIGKEINRVLTNVVLIPQNTQQQHMSFYGNNSFSQFLYTHSHTPQNKQDTISQIHSIEQIKGPHISSNWNQLPNIPGNYIPCLFLKGKKQKLIVFFHANAEDILISQQFLQQVNEYSQYSILAMQYCGYSIYNGNPDFQTIKNDSQKLIKYLFFHKFLQKDIILFGRSIGCSFALSLCIKYNFHALILLSPFISLKQVALNLYGPCAGWMLKEIIDKENMIDALKSPLLLIHGLNDTVIPYCHSIEIYQRCKGFAKLKLVENMTHSKFAFIQDLIKPLMKFLQSVNNEFIIHD